MRYVSESNCYGAIEGPGFVEGSLQDLSVIVQQTEEIEDDS